MPANRLGSPPPPILLNDSQPTVMPKMKTHRGAAKRFKTTGTGKIRRRSAYKNHILEKKAPKRKRQLRGPAQVSSADAPAVKRQLGL